VVSFDRDKMKKQPNIVVEMSTTDEKGQPTLAQPTTITLDKDIDEKEQGIPLRFLVPMNRAGEYKINLKATDKVTNKTSTVTLPIKVLPN
jgi:hypothetical protein